jgi:hypothetical protein
LRGHRHLGVAGRLESFLFFLSGAAAPAAPSEETRRADAVGVVKALLSALEQASPAAAAAEHGSASQNFSEEWEWGKEEIGLDLRLKGSRYYS